MSDPKEPTLTDISHLLFAMKAEQEGIAHGVVEVKKAHQHLASEVIELGRRMAKAEDRVRENAEAVTTAQYERDAFQRAVIRHQEKAQAGMMAEIQVLKENDVVQNRELLKLSRVEFSLDELVVAEKARKALEHIRDEKIKRWMIYLGAFAGVSTLIAKVLDLVLPHLR